MTLEEALEEIERLQDELFEERVKVHQCYALAYQWTDTGNGHWRDLLKALEGK